MLLPSFLDVLWYPIWSPASRTEACVSPAGLEAQLTALCSCPGSSKILNDYLMAMFRQLNDSPVIPNFCIAEES